MQNSNVKGHIVESVIFLVGYMVSSLVVLWGIGFGRLHQHGDTIVTYSILFGTLETLKILLTGKILRVVLFFTNVFTGYYLMAFIDIIRRRCSIHDISPLNTGTYELVLLLGIVLSGFSYILLLIKHLHSLYVIKNTVSPEEMTLSYNGTETAPFSEGAWILNTDMDIDSYYNYSRGNNSYDMRLLVSSEYIDTEQTARKIKESIKSDIAYFFLDHKINLKEHENCNTALFGTLVPKKK